MIANMEDNRHEEDPMRLKTKIMLAAIPAAALALTGTIIVVHVRRRRQRKREASSFLSPDVRDALQGLCSLKGEDFVTDGVQSSLYQRRLESLTDRQLIGVYILIKLAETLRARGISLRGLSTEELVSEAITLRAAAHNHDRHDLIKTLGSFGLETARGVFDDALLLASAGA